MGNFLSASLQWEDLWLYNVGVALSRITIARQSKVIEQIIEEFKLNPLNILKEIIKYIQKKGSVLFYITFK